MTAPDRLFKDMPFTTDGRAVLVLKTRENETFATPTELWSIPIDGAAPVKLDVDVSRVVLGGQGRMRLHPDGRHLAFVTGRYPVQEVWVLENFLPTPISR